VKSRSRGIGLIEVLVCIMINAFLVVVILKMYVMMNHHYARHHKIIFNQSSVNTVLYFLNYYLNLSGFVFDRNRFDHTVFPQNTVYLKDQVIRAENNINNDLRIKKHTDVLSLRFYNHVPLALRDCNNMILKENKVIDIDFYVDRSNNFRCRGGQSRSKRRYTSVLAESVIDFQLAFIYFEDKIQQLCDADCIDKRNKWNDVVAVTVLVVVGEQSNSRQSYRVTYALLES
jgi:Tfp pilus assembly protein PilW